MWARSYQHCDTVYWPGNHRVSSHHGSIYIDENYLVIGSLKRSQHRLGTLRVLTVDSEVRPQGAGLAIPYFLAVLLIAPLATFPWMRWHYSLRTLLIVTTLVAVGLGLTTAVRIIRAHVNSGPLNAAP